ncbi:type IV secretory system conjugative DNA transfer family protein [Marinobacterium sp. BA1]|uniref:type IV secretory system conjugative DNA transfer family protein n=1 Tax=Marinobacterium sp. BA1 TaxID=3138931 RepID=UPI0032E625F1
MLFDLPPMPPETQALIQQECRSTYASLIHAAPKEVIALQKSNKSTAESSGDDVKTSSSDIRNLRRNAIEQEAFSIGAQAGLAWRYKGIEYILESNQIEPLLDRALDFNRVITQKNILLPVISEAKESFEMSSDGQTARSSQMTWEIIVNARITTTPPSWREYLYQHAEAPTNAPSGLMPYDRGEQELWRMGICTGFQSGVEQANLIFTDRLTRLVRDYTGMLRFRTLAAQQVVSMPRIDEGRLGVSVQSDRVHVDDRIIRITDPVRFNNANQWRAVPGINQ